MIENIINFINTQLDVDITKNKRTDEYVFARIIYYKLATELTNLSKSNIGKAVNRDHCAVIHNLRNFDVAMKYPKLKNVYDTFKEYPLEEERASISEIMKVNALLVDEVQILKEKLNKSIIQNKKQKGIGKIQELLEGLTEEQLELVELRVAAIVKMI